MVQVIRPGATAPSSFLQVLRQVAAERTQDAVFERACGRGVVHLGVDVWLDGGTGPLSAVAAAQAAYGTEPYELQESRASTMHATMRMLEDTLSTGCLEAYEIKKLRRFVAATIHPDLHDGEDKAIAEELMKRANVLICSALAPQ